MWLGLLTKNFLRQQPCGLALITLEQLGPGCNRGHTGVLGDKTRESEVPAINMVDGKTFPVILHQACFYYLLLGQSN